MSAPRMARRLALGLLALASALTLRNPDVEARPKPYWMVSFTGGVLTPVGVTADERELGLGVGMRFGYTGRSGFGIAASAAYSPLPVVEPAAGASTDVTENHFVTAALVPRFTLGRGTLRLTLGAGGGGVMEQTRSSPASDPSATNVVTVFAPSVVGEAGIEIHMWGSGGLVLSSSYVRTYSERELEVASFLGGLVFTFR